MNTDEQIIAAQQLDPVEAGRIIRQLGDIAPDYQLASGPISDRLMGEIVRTFTKTAVEPWTCARCASMTRRGQIPLSMASKGATAWR